MNRLKAGIAAATGLVLGLPIGFVVSPDPTGVGPLVVGCVVGVVLAAGVYLAL
ncbi:hypothetical protein [Haloplanus sp. C73]|uniref:hypothetical protein n=1 Tax=Haloplanus sp. C73 TaxID=3421641 RepID=UPI003EBE3521